MPDIRQGSILGQGLRNITTNKALTPEDADDISLIISVRISEDTKRKVNQAALRTPYWLGPAV